MSSFRPARLLPSLLSTGAPILVPFALLAGATPALADTTITSGQTTPVLTSKAGNVTINSGGTVEVEGGTGVTVDSSSNVTVNSGGSITMGVNSNNVGIAIAAGQTTTISNSGTISVIENYTPPTLGNSSVAGGPIASATGRYGILAKGAVTGSVSNAGTIIVNGLNSAGIAFQGTVSGNVTNTGAISVKGDNSQGLLFSGAVTGTIAAGGSVAVVGHDTQDLVVAGDVTGEVKVDGALSQAVSFTTGSGTSQTLAPGALQTDTATSGVYSASLPGKAAVEIDGNVTGGVLVAIASSSTGATETTGSIQSYGTSPALQIGSARNITIGSVSATTGTYSLAIDGTVNASGYYSGISSYGVVIGGQGGTVTLGKGLAVYGTVTATTVDSSATALLINPGVTLGQGNTTTSYALGSSTSTEAAVSSVGSTLYVQGTIKAGASQPATGSITAIRDLSGQLTSIINSGYITVSGSAEGKFAAIDLSNTTSAVTISQVLNSTTASNQKTDKSGSSYTIASAPTYTAITGDIFTGSGSATFDIETGHVTGTTWLGSQTNTVKLADDAKWYGDIHTGAFGSVSSATGYAMTLSANAWYSGNLYLKNEVATINQNDSTIFTGSVQAGGGNLTYNLNSGTFILANYSYATGKSVTQSSIGTLNVGAKGVFGIYIDGATSTGSSLTANTVSFASGAQVTASFGSFLNSPSSTSGLTAAQRLALLEQPHTFAVIHANSITGASNIAGTAVSLPIIYQGTVTTTPTEVDLAIQLKTPTQLGLTGPESAAYFPILDNAQSYSGLATSLLQVSSTSALKTQIDGMLPDYAGGAFAFATGASRQAQHHLEDDSSIFSISNSGMWFEPIFFHATRHADDTIGYTVGGGGVDFGYEKATNLGRIGGYFVWNFGNLRNDSTQSGSANGYEINAFWRDYSGPLYAWARVGYGRETFKLGRTFTGAINGSSFTYTAADAWHGRVLSAAGGATYTAELGGNWKLKPRIGLDYYRMNEGGYQETGTNAIILLVNGRVSTQATATTVLGLSWASGHSSYDARPFGFEIEAGRRSILSGGLGATTATLPSGDAFTITPGAAKSAIVGQASIYQGGLDYTWKVTAGAEKPQNGGVGYSARASISIAL